MRLEPSSLGLPSIALQSRATLKLVWLKVDPINSRFLHSMCMEKDLFLKQLQLHQPLYLVHLQISVWFLQIPLKSLLSGIKHTTVETLSNHLMCIGIRVRLLLLLLQHPLLLMWFSLRLTIQGIQDYKLAFSTDSKYLLLMILARVNNP